MSFYSFLKFAVENHTENHTWLVANRGDLTYWLEEKKIEGKSKGFGLKSILRGLSGFVCSASTLNSSRTLDISWKDQKEFKSGISYRGSPPGDGHVESETLLGEGWAK